MIPTPHDNSTPHPDAPLVGGHGVSSADRAEKMASAVKELDRKFEERLAAQRAAALGLPYFNLYAFPIDQDSMQLLPKDQAEAAQAVIFYRDRQHLKIGILEPSNQKLQAALDRFRDLGFTPDLYLISQSAFEKTLPKYQQLKAPHAAYEEVRIWGDPPQALKKIKEMEQLGPAINRISATELINVLLTSAVAMDSSDIHLQAEVDHIAVRFRIDGVLTEVARFHPACYHGLTNRIKILSRLKINVTKVPQDGSFSVESAGHRYEIRVSLLPSAYGEAVVMRLLGSLVALDLDQLGLRHLAYEVVSREIAKPNGLILTTGPTGSGKTTTLYAFLKMANEPGVKIITLENPVEYRLENIEQVEINEKAGLTFASSLRSVLRQDPDIVMVGEIRDFDTAEVAAQAALTGHMVYSTLHTNDAAGAIPRLLNLGVKAVILAPALSCVIAQRLVRKLCAHCKREEQLDDKLYERVKHVLSMIPKASGAPVPAKLKFYHSPGCKECNNLGYKGRLGIFEVFPVDDAMQQLIFKGASTVEVKAQAQQAGMVTMIQDGILKALDGITDIAEVFRVAEE